MAALDEGGLRQRLESLRQGIPRSATRDLRPAAAPVDTHALGAEVEEVGRDLFAALFSDKIRECYRLSQQKALDEGKGLRIRLRFDSPELAALPWEFLYDEREGDFVVLSNKTPVIRYIELDQSPTAIAVEPPLRILAMAASPSDKAPPNVKRERKLMTASLDASLDDLVKTRTVSLTWLEGQSWRDLQRALRDGGPWHVFHFIGHGGFDEKRGEGVIALTSPKGVTDLLGATELGRLLAGHDSLRLAVLNACEGAKADTSNPFSSTASVLVRRGLAAVVAMQYEITDAAAVEFSHEFYHTLAGGKPVDAAVAEARKAVSFAETGSVEWATPVLHMRSPDGRLFVPAGAATTGNASAALSSGRWKLLAAALAVLAVGAVGGMLLWPGLQKPSEKSPLDPSEEEGSVSGDKDDDRDGLAPFPGGDADDKGLQAKSSSDLDPPSPQASSQRGPSGEQTPTGGGALSTITVTLPSGQQWTFPVDSGVSVNGENVTVTDESGAPVAKVSVSTPPPPRSPEVPAGCRSVLDPLLPPELSAVYAFPFDGIGLSADALERLNENVEELAKYPELYVRIDGYTDDREGAKVSPLRLSERRAMAVQAFYRNAGIAAHRIVQASGYGIHPSASSKEDPGPGDSRGRRVESVPLECRTLTETSVTPRGVEAARIAVLFPVSSWRL